MASILISLLAIWQPRAGAETRAVPAHQRQRTNDSSPLDVLRVAQRRRNGAERSLPLSHRGQHARLGLAAATTAATWVRLHKRCRHRPVLQRRRHRRRQHPRRLVHPQLPPGRRGAHSLLRAGTAGRGGQRADDAGADKRADLQLILYAHLLPDGAGRHAAAQRRLLRPHRLQPAPSRRCVRVALYVCSRFSLNPTPRLFSSASEGRKADCYHTKK